MPAYYRRTLETFLSDSATSVLGELAVANAAQKFQLTPQAIEAWRDQIPPLQQGIAELIVAIPSSGEWSVLLEYPIPIVGKRIDAVLLAGPLIIVVEIKTGECDTSAARQVDDYALNLACFHEFSSEKTIVPLVISEGHTAPNTARTAFDNLIEPCRFSTANYLGFTLQKICREHACESSAPINAQQWDEGRFKPIAPIIDAAVALYSDMNVFEIGHACAAREDLDKTTVALVSIVERARNQGKKVICFVTGVPGAGKTLVGLNSVHRPEIRTSGSFLSGNGPLVKVIQEALVRDVTKRARAQGAPISRREAELEVQAFVHNVHRFAAQYYKEEAREPSQHVVIFDEAQRAWDAAQNARAKRPAVSESRMMLEVMDRHRDWAVIIALIGGGQEINRGEAGLAEWGRAIAEFPQWEVFVSPHVLPGSASPAGFRLFESVESYPDQLQTNEHLHLAVCTRSIHAQKISDWVECLLGGDKERAIQFAQELRRRPVLTRSLATARDWLSQQRRGQTRAGLVASASAARLRADGLESAFDFHQGFDWAHWFLDNSECDDPKCNHQYCNDVRASSKLEVLATQFEIQGLELDWVGLCWGEDLTWQQDGWRFQRFNNKRWRCEMNSVKRTYMLNGYRVLLTRARQGMLIYVPKPPATDRSRDHLGLDSTTNFLLDCGVDLIAECN